MWRQAVFITGLALACLLLPFTILGVMFFGPIAVATVADWFCHG